MVQVPLVGMSDELEAKLLESMDSRATLGPTALPSAAFYTFVNSHHSLNCITTSSDGSCVAGQQTPLFLMPSAIFGSRGCHHSGAVAAFRTTADPHISNALLLRMG